MMTGIFVSRGRFRITLVGFTDREMDVFAAAYRRAPQASPVELKQVQQAGDGAYPNELVHAIVFTPMSLGLAAGRDVDAVRTATAPGTCRTYVVVPAGIHLPEGSPLDDFIQRTSQHNASAVTQEIADFFQEADALNRTSTIRGMRDQRRLAMYGLLKLAWPLSYGAAAFHIVNKIASYGGPPLMGQIANEWLVAATTFFGAFFIVHCVYTILRNFLFGVRVMRGISFGFLLRAAGFGVGAWLTTQSILITDGNQMRMAVGAALAAFVYRYYLVCRRTRAECSSMSAMQASMADPGRRHQMLQQIGMAPLSSAAFPFLPHRSKELFISYMHGSAWSSRTASNIHAALEKDRDFKVFMDRSALPPGGLWRQHLLRAASECCWFVAVLDDDFEATDWVLAESAYAILLRKSIGKPRILLVVRDEDVLARLNFYGPFGKLYAEILAYPPEQRIGAAVYFAGDGDISREALRKALKRIRPMRLL